MMFEMDRFEAVDIDYEFDFAVAEALMAKTLYGTPHPVQSALDRGRE